MKYGLPIALALLLFLESCAGQNQKASTNSSEQETVFLSGDTVHQTGSNIMVIYQDKNNVYWFGSWETGVYRYDGKSLQNYSTKQGLPYNRINEIKEDTLGHLYFSTGHPLSEIVRFDGKSFTRLSPSIRNEWKLREYDIWFKYPGFNGELLCYDGTTLHKLQLPPHPKYSNPFEIYSIYKDDRGYLWFGTNPLGVCRYNGSRFDWISEPDVTELHNGSANGVRSIVQDKEGCFWFNTEYRYRTTDFIHKNSDVFYERISSIGSLDEKKDGELVEYLSSVKDKEGSLWMATYLNGVYKWDGKRITHYTIKENEKQIKLFSLYIDAGGSLWLATHEKGVYVFRDSAFVQFNP
jgi:ligand-binding sensor domain-containing protein